VALAAFMLLEAIIAILGPPPEGESPEPVAVAA
jgi:hypothetical protein